MPRYGSADVGFFLVDGYDLLGFATQLTIEIEALLEETHTLGDAWAEQSPVNVKRASLTQEGFYDDAAAASNAALQGKEGISRIATIGLQGNTLAKKFVGFAGAMQVNYKRAISRGALHKANADYQGNGAVEDGVVLHTHKAETAASGNTEGADSVDNSASTANGGAGYLEVSALTLGGYTNIVVNVRHSADDITYATLITFTAVTSAPSAERKTVAGTVNRHTAVSWAFSGAGSGQSVTFMVGFVRS